MPHRTRSALARSRPLHATVRLRKHLPPLRSHRAHREILRCFSRLRRELGFRLVHYSIQSTHLHLICEVEDRRAMSRGMQGLLIRLAKALNKVWGRKGSVWADRYHEHVLGSPRQARNGLASVLNNLWRHLRGVDLQRHGVIDEFSSGRFFPGYAPHAGLPPPASPTGDPVSAPRTWLLLEGWRRHGPIRVDEVPRGLS